MDADGDHGRTGLVPSQVTLEDGTTTLAYRFRTAQAAETHLKLLDNTIEVFAKRH